MIAVNSPRNIKSKKDESVNSSASTAKMENKVMESDDPNTTTTNGTDHHNPLVGDAEKDLLNSLLDGSDDILEPGALSNDDDVDDEGEMVFESETVPPSASLSEQEAALEEALSSAIQEFQTAAAVGEDHSASAGSGGGQDDLLEAAAKSVATAEVEI